MNDFADITHRLADTGSAKWAVHFDAKARLAAGEDVVMLTIGEPDIPPDPLLIARAHEAMLAGRCGYSDSRGEGDLLAALVARYRQVKPNITHENILCFAGAQAALFVTFLGIINAGAGVMTPNPYYATYDGVISAGGGVRVDVPLSRDNGYRLSVDALEAAYEPHCTALLLNNPHNPTGAVLSTQKLHEIVQFCQKYDLWLICDEVYEALVYKKEIASMFAVAADYSKLVVISSISKTLAAPGFRSGWAVGSTDFCAKILPISEAIFFGNQPFIADATAWALRTKLDTAAQMRSDYQRRAKYIYQHLSNIRGLQPLMPDAGMFLFLDVAGTALSGQEFATGLLDYGVAVMPGNSFGAFGAAGVRLGLTVPDAQIAIAVERLRAFAQTW